MTDSGLKILVVDDDKSIQRYFHASISAHGNMVFEASNGEEALHAVVVNPQI